MRIFFPTYVKKRSFMDLFSDMLKHVYAKKLHVLTAIVASAALYHLIAFSFYLHGTLEGQINNHILAAEMWGTPDKMQERGIEPLYHGPVHTGWDGQFYFYIANDLLARDDTPEHIDSPSYRYQRVGMSLYAAAVSFIAGKEWVSPENYFISYFMLVLLATLFGAKLLIDRGMHPLFALIWPLSVGTQITMFNALPDAAADAFLILGLAALYARRVLVAIIPLTFAALSREVYILFPALIAAMYWMECLSQQRAKGNARWGSFLNSLGHAPLYYLAVPVCVTLGWQLFVTLKFGIAASSQAHGILGPPLAAWFDYFMAGLQGNHPVVGPSKWARAEALALFLFLLTLIAAIALPLYVLVARKARTAVERGIAVTTITLALLYACFGPTVAMYYTGYLKAASIFAFLIPLLLALVAPSPRWRIASFAFLATILLASSHYNWQIRILPGAGYDRYTRMSEVSDTRELPCLDSYEAGIELQGLEFIEQRGIRELIAGGEETLIAHVALKNEGHSPLVSTKKGPGSVHMSYHWLDEQGRVWRDGTRSAIIQPLQPGDSTIVAIVARMPTKPGRYTLRLSPVQEGCAWFYLTNAASAKDIKFQIR